MMTDKVVMIQDVGVAHPRQAVDFLALRSGLSKSLVKQVMTCGGVWRRRKGQRKLLRLRRATAVLEAGDGCSRSSGRLRIETG